MDIRDLKNKVIISVQAMPSEPLYEEKCLTAMMQSVVNGGAEGLRVAGVRDVKNAKKLFNIPVIGITKPDKLPDNWKEIVYITPTMKDVDAIIDAGADIVAIDGTLRPHECRVEDMVKRIKDAGKLAMADISTFEEGKYCEKIGFDIVSTTLSGYTQESLSDSDKPDFELLEKLVNGTKLAVILEGKIWEPSEVDKAFKIGATAVVIGSAITRPQLITKRFVKRG
ncbi:N-acetylmannosamine-6-phosphate 2-epimerase [bacterium]|nr:N-acetylmannosamine-6-phosphate 2-epimerase [bacterium]